MKRVMIAVLMVLVVNTVTQAADIRAFTGFARELPYVGFSAEHTAINWSVKAENRTFISGFHNQAGGFIPTIQEYTIQARYRMTGRAWMGYEHSCVHGIDRVRELEVFRHYATRHRLLLDWNL